MAPKNSTIPPGWIGGFAQSNPKFEYPNPDLSSLPLLDNMANIDLLKRQWPVEWPEFSWEVKKGDPKSRCFQMFAPYISRIGYDDTGRVYSIICPQQGVWIKDIGSLNIEVTVTGQRGWVDETNKENNLAADMTVVGKLWFSPDSHQNPFVKLLWHAFSSTGLPFPATKENAIVVSTHEFGNPNQSIFPVRKGETTLFKSPDFARHPEAWGVGNVEVEIGPVVKTGSDIVDEFNQMVVDLFNIGSGNILQSGTRLSWNVWFKEPRLVNTEEWRTHAERWRKSIDEKHTSPHGDGTAARYFDGTPFSPAREYIQEKIQELIEWITQHLIGYGQRA